MPLGVFIWPLEGHIGRRPMMLAKDAIEIFLRLFLLRILRRDCSLIKITVSIPDLLENAVNLVGRRLYLPILSLHMPQRLL